tara:strand:+ start:247 stop:465 length:219 start_codon:yes stop_codon:yes gene_type:complete
MDDSSSETVNLTNEKKGRSFNPLIFDSMSRCPVQPSLFRRLMAAGFVFFLVKGLVWIGIGAAAYFGFAASGG